MWEHPYHDGAACADCSHPDDEYANEHPIRYMVINALAILAFFFAMWILLVTLTPTAQAHSSHELEEWESQWVTHVAEAIETETKRAGLSMVVLWDLLEEYRDMADRHPCYFLGTGCYVKPKPAPVVDASVEGWRPLVAGHFAPGDVDRVLCLMWYESRGDPTAYNPSDARGLMQIKGWWTNDFPSLVPDDLFVPEINLFVARHVRDVQGWTAWAPYNRGLCR